MLGVMVNQDISWHNQLYGDEEKKGLVQQLRIRIGMVNGVRSKLKYCLAVFANIFNLV